MREGELVAVFGRAEQGDAEITKSPVTRQAALYCRVRVIAGRQSLFEDVSHGDFRVRDDSGRLLVLTEGGTDAVLPSVVPNDAAVRQWVDASLEGGPLMVSAKFVVEQTLIPRRPRSWPSAGPSAIPTTAGSICKRTRTTRRPSSSRTSRDTSSCGGSRREGGATRPSRSVRPWRYSRGVRC